MNNKIKNKKTIVYSIGILFIVALLVIVVAVFPFKSKILTSEEVFNDVDFSSKNADVNGYYMNFKDANKEYLKELQLSDEEKLAVIKAIENSSFERIPRTDTSLKEYDYIVYITLNKLYELNLDSTQKILVFTNEYDNDSDHLYYKISNDSDLFEILEDAF
ncbi:hypothetical protein [Solibacillus merdavium]|uniref:Uncharacterized protein n=1 Tax=Solibacillus merdavium TaxID=2762218 RepID=A0ABR8XSG6_9BACL|nr:hypothetical protein [Solibacillus merdavium]MBD8034881.1 hypothetical protein [Solibacillus merdavium]